ncbi:MAG: iron-sulfur cluster assembly scaffold protein [Pyrinomonadaceae bacterium]|nr:iron-sulfur cluster assembly scaffold protein [Pyrinomonadaceae bacterium]
MSFYPRKIEKLIADPGFAGDLETANASGSAASFVCGSALRLKVLINLESKQILQLKYRTSGCGFMIAAAEAVCQVIKNEKLTDFHGADDEFFHKLIDDRLGFVGNDRAHCINIVLEAVHRAFADFRAFQIEEFAGEKALVCTCFGVSEEVIEKLIAKNKATTVEEVGELCNAGTGCGSCQPLIQEIIDSGADIFN